MKHRNEINNNGIAKLLQDERNFYSVSKLLYWKQRKKEKEKKKEKKKCME